MRDYSALQQKVKAAWAKLPPDVRARLQPQILAAHQQMLAVNTLGAAAPAPAPVNRQLMSVYSMLNNDPDGLLRSAAKPAVVPAILPNTEPDTRPVPPG